MGDADRGDAEEEQDGKAERELDHGLATLAGRSATACEATSLAHR
jgi:hypothetical protein